MFSFLAIGSAALIICLPNPCDPQLHEKEKGESSLSDPILFDGNFQSHVESLANLF